MSIQLRLEGGGQTIVLAQGEGPPTLVYWGPTLTEPSLSEDLLEEAVAHGMLDDGERLDLWPEAGRGFTGKSAFECRRDDGSFITQLRALSPLTQGDGFDFPLVDAAAGVEVVLSVRLDQATGVATFQAAVRNTGDQVLDLAWVSAASLSPPGDEILLFDGRWSREFATARQRLVTGSMVKENRTGRTSHHAPPFLVAGEEGFGEHHGRVLGLHLAWSGDHRLLAERVRDGRLQLQAGELFWPGEVRLGPGETYRTPSLYAAKSDRGLNGLSARFHPFVRDVIMAGRLKDRRRPIHFNTWEAVYFRHDLSELMALADLAAEVGAERFILDDGWFKGRSDDRRALGDWTADPVKYPDGLAPLIEHVVARGLEFGLWVEPEMVNADSDLLRAHPDWILQAPGRRQPLGRGQHVLDLTRAEVAAHVFDAVDRLLRDHPIGYLKWDMNRDLTHAQSGGRPASRRQVLAVYALIDRLRDAHPKLEIEACASGGGRADYEILRRTDRIWVSDCNDPIERQTIQRGFSLFFPPAIMGAHVGPASSHTTARTSRLELRAMTALLGHMGIEADIRAFSAAERDELKEALSLHKQLRGLLHHGATLRQEVSDRGGIATMVVGPGEAIATYAQMETPAFATLAPLRLVGLEAETLYRVRLLNPPRRPQASMKHVPRFVAGEPLVASGRVLQERGLPLPVLRAGEISVFHLQSQGSPA